MPGLISDFTLKNKISILQWLFAFALYTISFGLGLTEGIYWDDWSILHTSREGIRSEFLDSGYVTCYLFLSSIYPITWLKAFLIKLIIFSGYFIASISLYYILLNIPAFRKGAFIISLFFLILPFNHARAAFATVNYVYNYAIFFIAFGLLTHYLKAGLLPLRILALLLFLLSFNMNSFFFFYALPLAFIVYHEKINERLSPKLALKYVDFIIIPILFLFVKYAFFPSKGAYEGYNDINLNALLSSPWTTVQYLFLAFSDLIKETKSAIKANYLTIIFLTVVLCIILRFLKIKLTNHLSAFSFPVISGILFFALLPYAIVGREPDFHAMNSRNQLLLPLGTALLIYYFVCRFIRVHALQIIVVAFLVSAFTIYNLEGMAQFKMDWFKQLSIMHHLKQNNQVKDASFIRVIDSAHRLNAKARVPVFNEYSAMTTEVYGDETRFLSTNLLDTLLIEKFIEHAEYKFTGYHPAGKRIMLHIKQEKSLSKYEQWRLIINQLLNDPRAWKEIEGLVSLRVYSM